ncbi:MAG: hypothetical protein H6R00_162 [Proteobacteria bacterium]|nr:hypothetical protein [Pseudomonadota bacterium]
MTSIPYTLKRPIKIAQGESEELITQLEINDDPDCGDLAATDAVEGDFHKTIALIAALAGIPYTTAKKIKPVDFNALNEIVTPIVKGTSGNA